MHTIRRRDAFALLAAAGASPFALAQSDWPRQPVKVVLGFPPGGGVDLTARIVASEVARWQKLVKDENISVPG